MKTRETGNPSYRTDGKGFVLPILQEIARMADSSQKFWVNHLFGTTIIPVAPQTLVDFSPSYCRPVPITRHEDVLPSKSPVCYFQQNVNHRECDTMSDLVGAYYERTGRRSVLSVSCLRLYRRESGGTKLFAR